MNQWKLIISFMQIIVARQQTFVNNERLSCLNVEHTFKIHHCSVMTVCESL